MSRRLPDSPHLMAWGLGAMALLSLLAGCFQPASTPSDGGLSQARQDAQAAAQADHPTSAQPAASSPTASPTTWGPPAQPGDLPVLHVGQTWKGTATATSTAQLTWQVLAVNETLDSDGHAYVTDRVRMTANRLTGTMWLRTADLAVVKSAWDQVQDTSQPYAAGSVTTYDPPCALHWPAQAGASWTSTCTVKSWSAASPTDVESASQTVAWSVRGGPSAFTLEGDGTLTYPDRPDSTTHFTQTIQVGQAACEPLAWALSTSQGATERLDALC